ncbi:MAG: ribosome biogenesis GTPase YlqF [Lachnospiraceae bacterium]|nr:ribosome biogenesis GTPase YlqF [Lachnospiraceae bacterium]
MSKETEINENKKDSINSINWYPGHMTKAKRMMEENIKLVDLVIEIIDARAPLSSRNPDIDKLSANKFRLVLMNKSDMADKAENEKWCRYFESKGIKCVLINSRTGYGIKNLDNIIKEVCKDKIERDRKRGILKRSIKCMIVGIPNVGKSTFINSISRKSAAKTGNKPGVTKGKQWISVKNDFELLDTPGILWPKFDDKRTGIVLALIGSVNDDILQFEDLSFMLIDILKNKYPGALNAKLSIDENLDNIDILSEYARLRNLVKTGGELDLTRASKMLTDEFRNNKLGFFTLDYIPE